MEAKYFKEKMDVIKSITKGKKLNIFRVEKKEEFVSFQDWQTAR